MSGGIVKSKGLSLPELQVGKHLDQCIQTVGRDPPGGLLPDVR